MWKSLNKSKYLLFGILIFLLIVLIYKNDLLPRSYNESEARNIDAISKIVTTLFLIITGIFAYLKFFKGRTLSTKAIISIKSGRVQKLKDTYWFEVQIENKGSVAIIDYKIIVYIYSIKTSSINRRRAKLFPNPPGLEGRFIIDIGESAYFHGLTSTLSDTNAVIFQAVVYDQDHTAWWRSHTHNDIN